MPEMLDNEMPEGMDYLWQAFCELSDSRSAGMTGPGAIPESEIHFYQRNHCIRFLPWELDCLRALDRCFRSVMNET